MKKHLMVTLMVGLAVTILTGSALAALQEREGNAASRPTSQARGEMIVNHILGELALTDSAKEAQVRSALETFFQAEVSFLEKNGPELKTLRGELVKARQAKDQTKIEKILGQIQDLRKPLRQAHETLIQQIKSAGLTQDQLEGTRHMITGLRILERFHMLMDKLEITDDQRAKINEIFMAARVEAENATTFAERKQIFEAALEKIKSDVLTADQRTKLKELEKEYPAMTQPDKAEKK